ncbi:MAG: hypothetical protein ACREVH_03270 [Gammaproteobacteria bacterium]
MQRVTLSEAHGYPLEGLPNLQTLGEHYMNNGDKRFKSLTIILLALGFAACEQQGPAERAGARVDKAMEEAKEALDPQGPAERAGEQLDKTVEQAKEKAQ